VYARLRRVLLSVPALTIAGLLLAYLLFAWLGFDPLLRWALPKWVADSTGHELTIEQARFDPFRLAVDVQGLRLAEPGGKPLLGLARLYVNFDALGSIGHRAWAFDELRVGRPVLQLELRRDGWINWQRLFDALASGPPPAAEAEKAPTRILLQHLALEAGRIDLSDQRYADGFQTSIDPLDIALDRLSTLPQDRGGHTVSAVTGIGATVRWKGEVGLNPLLATGEVAVDELLLDRLWPYARQRLQMAPPQGKAGLSLAYRISIEQRRFNVALERVDAKVEQLALTGRNASEPAIALGTLHLGGGRFDLQRREASFESAGISGGRIALALDANGRPDLLDWLPQAAAPASAPAAAPAPPVAASAAAPAGAASAADPPWRLGIGQVGIDGLALRVVDAGFSAALTTTVDQLKLGFKLQAALGGATPELGIDGFGLELAGIRLASAGLAQPWFELAKLGFEDGRLALPQRELSLGRVALSGGRFAAGRGADGKVALQTALARTGSTDSAPSPSSPASAAGAAAPWRYRVGKIDASDFALALSDASVTPPATLTLEDIRAEASNLSEDPKAELPVTLQLRVREGGRFEAAGKIVPAPWAADLQLKLSDLALAIAQPYIAQSTTLTLAGGHASTQGRLRWVQGEPRYEGGFALRDLRLNEQSSRDRLLAWKSLGSTRLAVTPQRLQVGELVVDGLGAKLVVSPERKVNVAQLMKPGAAASAPAAAPAPPAATAAKAPATKPAPAYRVDVERVRFVNGDVDFADLSLALPFGARINELKGQMVGLSSAPGAATQVELDGKVDAYGLARAVGQINLFDPAAYTDLKVVFRNVEMTSLTPYSATFAGRKIESGKLSLDLEYKVKERQLAGENKVVMDKLTLGERVESKSALNLPLDLAIALLQDSSGKIDLGLPVAGSLDDPQFSYGALIWKAIANVITKIVTAPFRALGALFGAGNETLDKIAFDVGKAELLPPEREKLVKLAKGLEQRPTLALSVRGAFDPQADRNAIRELQLRRAVATQGGRTLAPGEDPGPISSAQPATREALDKLFVARFGADALATLRQRHQQANPGPPPSNAAGRMLSQFGTLLKGTPAPLPAEEEARLHGADLHALMMQRLLEAEAVDDERLRGLGQQRAETIRRELLAQGLAAERCRIEPPEAQPGSGTVVQATLGMSAGAPAAPAAPAASAPAPASR